jgi:hypothetical protein
MSFVEVISVNVILHVGTTRIPIAVFYYFLLGEDCFIVITMQGTSNEDAPPSPKLRRRATVGVIFPVNRQQGAARCTRK